MPSPGKLLTISASFSCLSSSICTSFCLLRSFSSASLRRSSNSRACCKHTNTSSYLIQVNQRLPVPFSYLDDAFDLQVLPVFLRPLQLLDVGVVRLAAPAAAAAPEAPAAFTGALIALEPPLQFELLVKGGLSLTLQTEGGLKS